MAEVSELEYLQPLEVQLTLHPKNVQTLRIL